MRAHTATSKLTAIRTADEVAWRLISRATSPAGTLTTHLSAVECPYRCRPELHERLRLLHAHSEDKLPLPILARRALLLAGRAVRTVQELAKRLLLLFRDVRLLSISLSVEASDEVVVEVCGGSSSRLVMFEDLGRASPRLYPDHLAEGLNAVEMTLSRPRRVEEL